MRPGPADPVHAAGHLVILEVTRGSVRLPARSCVGAGFPAEAVRVLDDESTAHALVLRTGPTAPADPLKDADRDDRDDGHEEEEGQGAQKQEQHEAVSTLEPIHDCSRDSEESGHRHERPGREVTATVPAADLKIGGRVDSRAGAV